VETVPELVFVILEKRRSITSPCRVGFAKFIVLGSLSLGLVGSLVLFAVAAHCVVCLAVVFCVCKLGVSVLLCWR
jgi:hypothetical protein